MPSIERTEDAITAAAEIWREITSSPTAHSTLYYGEIELSVAYCQEHRIYEVMLAATTNINQLLGFGSIASECDLARVIDAVLCMSELMRGAEMHAVQLPPYLTPIIA